jgi:hypothetical protein
MAVYSRGERAKERNNREDKGKSMSNRCYHMQKATGIKRGQPWSMHSATRQSLHDKGISEPPFLPGDEQIGGEGVIDEPMKHQQHLDGLLPQGDRASQRTPERKGKVKNSKGSV